MQFKPHHRCGKDQRENKKYAIDKVTAIVDLRGICIICEDIGPPGLMDMICGQRGGGGMWIVDQLI